MSRLDYLKRQQARRGHGGHWRVEVSTRHDLLSRGVSVWICNDCGCQFELPAAESITRR